MIETVEIEKGIFAKLPESLTCLRIFRYRPVSIWVESRFLRAGSSKRIDMVCVKFKSSNLVGIRGFWDEFRDELNSEMMKIEIVE
jgi:hypothetical protein